MATRAHPTVAQYAEEWLGLCATLKAGTVEVYTRNLRKHVLPAIGRKRLRNVTRREVRGMLAALRKRGLSRETVRLVLATARAMFSAALEDELLEANPAAGVARGLRLTASKRERTEKTHALRGDQLSALLEACPSHFRPMFFVMSRSGLRLGEALSLKWSDVDWRRQTVRVERTLNRNRTTTSPKSGHGRTVDLSDTAVEALRELGDRGVRSWFFPASDGRPYALGTAQAAFRAARKAARLPEHFTSHCLRHTYASVLLAGGVSPAYVQEQLGHSSVELTVGVYGRWLRKKAPGALDLLEAASAVA